MPISSSASRRGLSLMRRNMAVPSSRYFLIDRLSSSSVMRDPVPGTGECRIRAACRPRDTRAPVQDRGGTMKIYRNVLEMVGRTPMLEVSRFDTGPCRLFLKLELANPGGSIKDRIGVSMIEEAEKRGDLKPGDTIVEATAGNTGIALALVAAQKGYHLVLVIPDKMSQEKIFNLRAMGAEVVLTRSDVGKGHPEYYQDLGKRIADERGAYFINQFGNPDNPLAHERTTAPEIWEQMDGDVDAVVVGVGSSGTISGMSTYFREHETGVKMILADPEGSVLADYVETGELGEKGSWLAEGIGA